MKKLLIVLIIIIITAGFIFTLCKKDKEEKDEAWAETTMNLFFKIDKDKEFGKQFDQQLESDPEYNVLSRDDYLEAYEHLDSMRDAILQSHYLNYADEFDWQIKIIDDDVLNAFCAPAGYMYYYTGLIKYLDNEAQLAGVMGHEMAHADKRHVTKRLLILHGLDLLTNIILGDNPSDLEVIITDLAKGGGMLQFSRTNEYEADEFAIKYTSDTEYYPLGIAGFFEKLEAEKEKGIRIPAFLSTHPSPENRLEAMDTVYTSIDSPPGELFEERYQELKNYLP